MKIIRRLLKRNRKLYELYKLYERLALCVIRDNDNAFQRNLKAVEYIDERYAELQRFKKSEGNNDSYNMNIEKFLKDLRRILTCFESENIFDEVNRKVNK